MNGAGEMLVFSAADFEDFLEPRPDLQPVMEAELKKVVGLLAAKRWPFRLHATYDESISRFLDVFEEVDREIPFQGLRWFFDHAETISEQNMERVKRLGGGIAIQDRMAFQGEYFVARYGAEAAERTPPITRMLELGIPVGAGTDATRVSSYNPWVSLYWLVSGRTVGGLPLYDEKNRLDRTAALRLYTEGSCLVLRRRGKEGADCGGTVCRPGGAVGRLLHRSRRGDQGDRGGADHHGGEDCPWQRRFRSPGAPPAAGQPRLVAGSQLWRLPPRQCGSSCCIVRGAPATATGRSGRRKSPGSGGSAATASLSESFMLSPESVSFG